MYTMIQIQRHCPQLYDALSNRRLSYCLLFMYTFQLKLQWDIKVGEGSKISIFFAIYYFHATREWLSQDIVASDSR